MNEEEIIIAMLESVFTCFPYNNSLRAGFTFRARSNRNGAISAIKEDGTVIGVKPGEFIFLKAPEWVLNIHTKRFPEYLTVKSALECLEELKS